MRSNQSNMRLMKIAGAAAIFGALTLSGCKSSKENGSDANDQELNTVYQGQKGLYDKYTKEYKTAVKEMYAEPKKENYTKESLTATVHSANDSAKQSSEKSVGTLVGYYEQPRVLTEKDLEAANNNPSGFKYGHIIAVKKNGEVIKSDEGENTADLEYVFSNDLGLNMVRDGKTFKVKARDEVTLKRNQFLVDKSKVVQGKKTCAQIKAEFEKDMRDLQAKHQKTWSKMDSLKSEKKTKITDKQQKLRQAEEQCFDVQSHLNYESAGKFEFVAADVKEYHEAMERFFKTEMAQYTEEMKKAKGEITDKKYGQCATVDATFVQAKEKYEREQFPNASKRCQVREMVSNFHIKNFDQAAAKKFWDMVQAGTQDYRKAKAECDKVANAMAPKTDN